MTSALRWGRASDPGRIRQQNEDSVLVEDNLFAVADGMGGHKAGEVASALTVELLKRRLGDTTSSLDDVLSAVVDANGEIFTAATANIDQQGMGTTLTGLFVVTAATADGDTLAGGSTDAAPSSRSRRGSAFRCAARVAATQPLSRCPSGMWSPAAAADTTPSVAAVWSMSVCSS